MCHNFFIHSPVNGYLGCFHVLAFVNSAAGNNGIHVSLSVFISSGYMARTGIAGSYDGFFSSFFLIVKSSISPLIFISITYYYYFFFKANTIYTLWMVVGVFFFSFFF